MIFLALLNFSLHFFLYHEHRCRRNFCVCINNSFFFCLSQSHLRRHTFYMREGGRE
jgi:hypothetical protein